MNIDLEKYPDKFTYKQILFTKNVVITNKTVSNKKKGEEIQYKYQLLVYMHHPITGKRFQKPGTENEEHTTENDNTISSAGSVELVVDNAAELDVIGIENNESLKKENKAETINRKVYHDVFSSTYLRNGCSKKMIDDKANEMAARLFARYEKTLIRILNEAPSTGDITSMQMHERLANEFFKERRTVEDTTLRNYRNVLESACVKLDGGTPIPLIRKERIKELFENPTMIKFKKLIEDFFEYGRNNGAYNGVNPVADYLANHYFARIGKKKNFYSEQISHLPLENELKLHEIIERHIDDDEIMSIIALKCIGISLAEAIELRWDTFITVDGCIIYSLRNEKNKGSVHNFSRPVLAEGEYFIKKIFNRLNEKYGSDEKWKSKRIIPIRGSEKDKKSRLTNYIRRSLIESGLTNLEISSASPGDKRTGGAGATLLKNHYRYVLDNRCGLIRDSADYRYMCGLVPNDILHGHYRSMSDSISGIPYFKTIARRDDFFWPSKEENEDTCERITENGVTKLIAHSSGPRKKTIIRGKIYIPEDTVITFGSDYGVCGQLSYYDDYGKTAIVKRLY